MKTLSAKLKKLLDEAIKQRAEIPPTNYFGDNNWDDMDLEISILRLAVKNPTPNNLKVLISDCNGEIEELEDNCDDDDEQAYGIMDRTRSMYQNLIDTLEELI